MKPKLLYAASSYIHLMNFHLPYLRAFRERGWEVHALCADPKGEIPFADRTITAPLRKKMSAPENFIAASRIRSLVKDEGYALVIVHTSLAAFFVRLALKGLRQRPRLINMVHGYLFDDDTPAPKRQILLAAEKMTAPQTDLLITMNRWDHELAQKQRLAAREVFVPGVGVDFSRFATASPEAGARLREALGIPAEDYVLLCAAELSGRKSQPVLIRALSALPEKVRLVLAGSGAEQENCMALAKELGLEERVLFPGHVGNIGDWYAMADAVATASRIEGLPFNVMEAMVLRKPVVASRVKGHEDLIEDGRTGLLYPYGDSAACAAAIRRLMEEPGLGERLAEAAQAQIGQYALERVFPQVMAAYESVTGEPVRA
ncbi:MAG: glycosyltransferase [Oscillospiraceae bacterium]|nr:glycosyltransferase [Oscillospiraceae bacterium]